MLSVLDIVIISLGGICVVLYTTIKIIKVLKFKKMIQLGLEHGLTETQARENAYRSVYNKKKKIEETEEIMED